MSSFTSYLRQFAVALRFFVVATLALGVVYPLLVWATGQLAMPAQANGSVISDGSNKVASSLIEQIPDAKSKQWFFPRPSAVNGDPQASGPSNLGPNDPKLRDEIAAATKTVAQRENVAESAVPADAVTASGSGLDPDISESYALLQLPRVARETGLGEQKVRELVAKNTSGSIESLLGQRSVNVTTLNVDLAHAMAK